VRRVRLRNFMEMEPRRENRIVLSEELDVYGQRVPIVRHTASELDRRSMIALHQALVAEFAQAGVGKLETTLATCDPWPIDRDASHHMGTTRMGKDPATSVVDTDGRIHGVDNVFMAGASVFPTSGCANPTFTIVALSIRLAEHLRAKVKPRSTSVREAAQ
jgi:choline dehydrogenase-like flavoprotein